MSVNGTTQVLARTMNGVKPKASAVVRPATVADLDGLVVLLFMMGREMSLFQVNEAKSIAFIQSVLSTGFVLVAELNGEIVGSIGLTLTSFWYSDDTALVDTWFYIKPNARRSSVALRLLRGAKQHSKELGLILIVGVFNLQETARKNKLYERLFTPIGEFFVTGV